MKSSTVHKSRSLVLILLSILFFSALDAQRKKTQNRFGAGIIIGLNANQINGDHLKGYDKIGSFVGLRATARLDRLSEIVIEMQYNQKGSKDPNQFVPGRETERFISLDYIEVPILFHKIIKTNSIYYSLEGGLAYARLLGFRINENPSTVNYNTFTDIQDELNNQDLALVVGGGLIVSDHIRLMTRFAYSLTLLYQNERPLTNFPGELPEINKLRNVQLAFGANYIF